MENFNSIMLKKYYESYLAHGARSSKKLDVVHGNIARSIKDILLKQSKNYVIKSKGYADEKEHKVPGLLYDKNSDITIIKDEIPKAIVSVKLPTSNYKQNANNYFESMLGETANLKSNNIKVAHAIFLPFMLPYFDKDGNISKLEKISNSDIDKYRKLMAQNSIITPDSLFLAIVEYGVEELFKLGLTKKEFKSINVTKTPKILDMQELLNNGFSEENAKFIFNHSNYNNFITRIASSVN